MISNTFSFEIDGAVLSGSVFTAYDTTIILYHSILSVKAVIVNCFYTLLLLLDTYRGEL